LFELAERIRSRARARAYAPINSGLRLRNRVFQFGAVNGEAGSRRMLSQKPRPLSAGPSLRSDRTTRDISWRIRYRRCLPANTVYAVLTRSANDEEEEETRLLTRREREEAVVAVSLSSLSDLSIAQ